MTLIFAQKQRKTILGPEMVKYIIILVTITLLENHEGKF